MKMGVILGLIAPLLSMFVYYFWKFYPTFGLVEFFKLLVSHKPLITALSSFSLLSNAVLFTIYINTHRDMTAKGIFIITCIYAVFCIALKIIVH